jgi:hypothetical protein
MSEELGVYDDLLHCVAEGFPEHGVLEYRFWQLAPTTYTTLVETYGHKYLTEGLSYSASAFLARALSQLAGEELIFGTLVPATGRWEYNGRTGGYGPKGTSGSDPCLSWEQFAGHTLGINPEEWPPLADWTKPAPPAI